LGFAIAQPSQYPTLILTNEELQRRKPLWTALADLSYKNHLRLALYYRAIELLELSYGIATQSQSP